MTQKELAERLSVTDKAVSQWERGCVFQTFAHRSAHNRAASFFDRDLYQFNRAGRTAGGNGYGHSEHTPPLPRQALKAKSNGTNGSGARFSPFPLCAFLAWLGVTALLVYAVPQAAFTETAAFLLLAPWLYLLQLGLPFLFGYSILIWKDSHFMRTEKRRV